MKNSAQYLNRKFLKQFLALGVLFFVLISTCSIQRGLKTFFGFPIEVSKTTKGAKIATASFSSVNCTKCGDMQMLTIDQPQTQSMATAILLTAIFSFILTVFIFYKENNLILEIPVSTGELPKYLLFSRLLYYDLK